MTPEDEFFLYGRTHKSSKFKVVGFLPSAEFQKCVYLAERLHISYPKEYDKPEIRGLMNLDWDEYLTKMKRRYGMPFYLLKSPVAVYFDGDLLGDSASLVAYTKEKYNMALNIDFEEIAEREIINYFSKLIEKYKRKFVFLTFAIDEHVVGSMLFMLYSDLVPKTCDNFMARCINNCESHGYKGAQVHRVAKHSWVQCGGVKLQHVHMACENYTVPHDRRGVLSMCNKQRHQDNSTQFLITLAPTPWMDYNYVAFGQLIQGAEILNLIENVPTYYENPLRKIQINNCGEFSLCPVPDDDYKKTLNPSHLELFSEEIKDDIDSVLSETNYKAGKYFLKTDLQPYLPFKRYSQMFNKFLQATVEPLEYLEEAAKSDAEEENDRKANALFKSSAPFFIKKNYAFKKD